jgi:hypothetical protein
MHNVELRNLYASPNMYQGDQTKDDEQGGAGSTHGRDDKCIRNVGWKT